MAITLPGKVFVETPGGVFLMIYLTDVAGAKKVTATPFPCHQGGGED